jgi:hypothetical protein
MKAEKKYIMKYILVINVRIYFNIYNNVYTLRYIELYQMHSFLSNGIFNIQKKVTSN